VVVVDVAVVIAKFIKSSQELDDDHVVSTLAIRIMMMIEYYCVLTHQRRLEGGRPPWPVRPS